MGARSLRRFIMRTRPPVAAGGILLGLLAVAPPARAQFVPPSEIEEQQSLEAVVDSAVNGALGEFNVPGAVVAVVKDGRLLLAKGYGFADLETRRRVMAGETVFRVGSVSKPVTATAVMQLVQRGKLDLHADVNTYLRSFRVDARFAAPVTIAALLTHTAGFDVRLNGTAAPTEEAVLPLERYLARDLPPRIRPPGEVLAYSNHGYALLGHLVEIASGWPFDEYVRDNILRPLGMRRSGFRLSGELQRALATGYEPAPGGPRRSAPIHPNIYPAAGFSTTATDMARFMLAHLEGGGAGGPGGAEAPRILSPATLEEMHRRQFAADPSMPGVTYGFFEEVENGAPLLLHGGGLRGFTSGVYLWPDRRLGLFVSNNGYSVDLVWRVFYKFADAYFPATRTEPVPIAGARRRAGRCAGTYRLAHHPRRNLEAAGALRGGDLEVGVDDDGSLSIFGLRFVETSPLHFREGKRDTPAAFVEDPGGRVRFMLTSDPFYGIETWERVPWYGGGSLHAALLGLMVVIFLSAPLFNPAAAQVRGLFEAGFESPPWSRTARRAALTACGLDLMFLAGMVLAFRLSRDTGLLYGVPILLRLSLILPLAGLLPAAGMLASCLRAWRKGSFRVRERLHYSLLTAGAAVFPLFLAYWNLLGFRY